MKPGDPAYLRHMLDAIIHIENFSLENYLSLRS
jgi:hypothetical protein